MTKRKNLIGQTFGKLTVIGDDEKLVYPSGSTVWRVRCSNTKHPSYKDYGGRGITFCEEWKNIETFIADMGERPEGYTLERVDTNGNYSKDNCIWATSVIQNQNKRDTVLNPKLVLELREAYKTKPNYRELSRIFGLHPRTISDAIQRKTWKNI